MLESRLFLQAAGFTLLFAGGGGLLGCDSSQSEPSYTAIEGTFESIDPRNGSTQFRFRQEKTGQYKKVAGFIGPKCEILINGMLAQRSDIKEGEDAFVVWRIEHVGSRQINQALRIRIHRNDRESETD